VAGTAKEIVVSNVQTRFGAIGIAANGTDAGPPILFLHGVGSDKSVWHPQLEHFRGRRTAIAIDYPGYGESEPREGATRDDYARAGLAALDAMGRSQAHICGLSLGGIVAVAMHALAPERCLSLVLADTFAKHPDGRAIYDRSLAASENMRALAEARVDVLIAQPADPAVRSEVVETMARIDPAAFRIGAEAVWLADQADRAAQIRIPTLVVCGTEDKVTPPPLSHELMALIPGARYETIERAGHLANLERPDAFNTLVEAFTDRVDSAS
jgi:3-oxoadipate enol-lactonase